MKSASAVSANPFCGDLGRANEHLQWDTGLGHDLFRPLAASGLDPTLQPAIVGLRNSEEIGCFVLAETMRVPPRREVRIGANRDLLRN